MSFPKILALLSLFLFGTIALVAALKNNDPTPESPALSSMSAPVEIHLDASSQSVIPATPKRAAKLASAQNAPAKPVQEAQSAKKQEVAIQPEAAAAENLPEVNRVAELFSKEGDKLPIVETITYKSRVTWLKGRPAWLSDYASHYQTSRHFIARSLHGKPDYFKQDLAEGEKFNVYKKDKKIEFYLVTDVSRCKMWLYYYDVAANECTLLKTYKVGLGRVDSSKASGLLTPLGKYTLGNKIAIYKPKMMGYHNGERVEMIGVFGTRWIPFDKENGKCTAPAKGFGIHGVPWPAVASGTRAQDTGSIGKYQSDGCVRLATEDIEEIFAIVITKPTIIELVKDFHDAELPGKAVKQ